MSKGENIKRIRQEKKISRECLANKVGMSVFTVAKYEQNSRQLSVAMLYKIADALGTPVSELIKEDDNESTEPKSVGENIEIISIHIKTEEDKINIQKLKEIAKVLGLNIESKGDN